MLRDLHWSRLHNYKWCGQRLGHNDFNICGLFYDITFFQALIYKIPRVQGYRSPAQMGQVLFFDFKELPLDLTVCVCVHMCVTMKGKLPNKVALFFFLDL